MGSEMCIRDSEEAGQIDINSRTTAQINNGLALKLRRDSASTPVELAQDLRVDYRHHFLLFWCHDHFSKAAGVGYDVLRLLEGLSVVLLDVTVDFLFLRF